MTGLGVIRLSMGKGGGCCGRGDETLSSTKCGDFD